jgi:hypothetical protein
MRVKPDRLIRVLIVDDHVAIRVGLKSMLEAQGGILLPLFRTSSWSIFVCTA